MGLTEKKKQFTIRKKRIPVQTCLQRCLTCCLRVGKFSGLYE